MTLHDEIMEYIRAGILDGKYKLGDRVPSEEALSRKFGTTRVTVGKALRELGIKGFIKRRRGSGSFVTYGTRENSLLFGLLMPQLGEGEIFEPISNALATVLAERGHRLMWSQIPKEGVKSKGSQVLNLCRSYVDQNVDGVFFAPIEFVGDMFETNKQVAALLKDAGIPVVLIDWDVERYPDRSCYDLVGIDNHRAGNMLAGHLLELGCTRIAFAAFPDSAQTVTARIAGYHEALIEHGLPVRSNMIFSGDPADDAAIGKFLKKARPDAVICCNDFCAALVIRALTRAGYKIPDDIKVTGVDDLSYASLLGVPLTTVAQPCEAIGRSAADAMFQRIADPFQPARRILVNIELKVRESTAGK